MQDKSAKEPKEEAAPLRMAPSHQYARRIHRKRAALLDPAAVERIHGEEYLAPRSGPLRILRRAVKAYEDAEKEKNREEAKSAKPPKRKHPLLGVLGVIDKQKVRKCT